MRLNKIVKALAVSIPLFTLAACSSTDTSEQDAQKSAQQAADAAKAEANRIAREAEQVRVAAAQREERIAEKQRKQMQSLLTENIIYFGFDQSTLSNEFSSILDAHAKFLNANPGKNVLVEGHADERGTPEYNIALGERRAKSVVAYLENMGVSSSQISIVSYGEEKPMVKDHTESAFAKNRRAVLAY